jgi:hypothetical protein
VVGVGLVTGPLVALVVVAVAHRRLAPSFSATTSATERALPSSAVRSLLESAHDHSAVSASDESHLIRAGPKPPESVTAQSVLAVTACDLLTIC